MAYVRRRATTIRRSRLVRTRYPSRRYPIRTRFSRSSFPSRPRMLINRTRRF